MTTQVNDLFECLLWIPTLVKSTMEGDLHALCCLHQCSAMGHVDIALGCECPYHHAIGSKLVSHSYVGFYDAKLLVIIDEVSFTRTDEHMEPEPRYASCLSDETYRGCQAVRFEGSTKLDALCTALCSSMGALDVAATNL